MTRKFKAALLAALVAWPLLPAVSFAEGGLSGAYLAARQASFYSDFDAAAEWYGQAMQRDPGNPVLMENALTAYVGLGDIDQAAPLAREMRAAGLNSQSAALVTIADLGRTGAFEALLQEFEGALAVGPLVDGLVIAWAQVGAGQMGLALEGFDAVAADESTRAFGLYHKALALALVGDFEGADAILSGAAEGPLRATVHGVLAHAGVLSQLERNDDALALLESVFGDSADPIVTEMRDTLNAGQRLPLSVVSSARDGLSEVFFSIAGVLENEADANYTLLYSRAAEFLNPGNIAAMLLTASLLESLDQYALATKAYDQVPRSHPSFHEAEIGRAEALRQSGNNEAAIEVLTQLAESRFDLPAVHNALGDALRGMQRFDDASQAYDRAIALLGEPRPGHWIAFYSRGITHERVGRWELAEADFRHALELSPGQPYVLNYLGYSLVEHQIKLDEALRMIEEAVAARPDDGFVTDSLGWVLYRLGRYQEAVAHMERAAGLEPVDPIVNDHLGDVLWAVGRTREAQFQWRRAMSLEPEEKDAERIRRKLESGLDVVLEEEGAAPLAVAGNNGKDG